MDLAAIQNKLTGLGVSLRFEFDPAGSANELQRQRQYRSALYIDRLEQAQNFLTQTLAGAVQNGDAGGLGSGYPFCATALADGELLNQLASDLDEWVCGAVEGAITTARSTYVGWFTNTLFAGTDQDYRTRVTQFFTTYPITGHALTKILANFENNIRIALRRLLGDRAAIRRLFQDRFPGLTLNSLDQIRSTGSDFHKGGQQVLILTFATTYQADTAPVTTTMKLVYKPADIEVDCLIAGDSAAVNKATADPAYPTFLTSSLIEIFNAYVRANPSAGLETLPTYRILPRRPTSRYSTPPYPIRAAYGYLEYLSYWEGQPLSVFSRYSSGASDYLIATSRRKLPIIDRFYRQAGQLMALAAVFALADLHVENVRAHRFEPYLIDLETSLTMRITKITETLLLNTQQGGFNARSESVTVKFFVDPVGPRDGYFEDRGSSRYFANRLVTLQPVRKVVPIDCAALLDGLQRGMAALRTMQQSTRFDTWLQRTNGVLVRVLPLSTKTWTTARKGIYYYAAQDGKTDLGGEVGSEQLRAVTTSYTEYVRSRTPEPDYVAAAAPQVRDDLLNFDVPTFYHRIGTCDLLDSTGAVIAVPKVVRTSDGFVTTNLPRTTFFYVPPTAKRVGGQLTALTGTGFKALVDGYVNQSTTVLGIAMETTSPTVLTG